MLRENEGRGSGPLGEGKGKAGIGTRGKESRVGLIYRWQAMIRRNEQLMMQADSHNRGDWHQLILFARL